MDLFKSETMSVDDASSIFSSEDGECEETDHMKKVDQQHRLLIDKIFRPILRDCLVPTILIKRLRIVKDKRPELMRLERSLPRHEVVDKLLDFVIQSQKRHWFESFLEALQDAGYVELMKLVSPNGQFQEKDTFHLLMQHCYDLLLDEASPEELLTELFDAKVLDEDDANEIANTISDEGSRSGMTLIICRIALHSDTWFEDLKTALESTKKFSLVEKLDTIMVGLKSDGREGKGLMNDLKDAMDELMLDELDMRLDELVMRPVPQLNISGAESSIESNDRVTHEGDEDAVEPAAPNIQEIQLRSYQLELADRVIGVDEVKNSLIVAPTGCGKTIVAAEIIKRHLMKNPESKVLFLVPTVALVHQQFEVLYNYPIPDARIKSISGDASGFQYIKKKYNIMVMTPQVLVNVCDYGSLSSFGIGLMVFDECHHSMKDHPYSKIMALYHDLKPSPDRPRIVGMTASVGVGKAKNEDDAVKYIISLLANMDTHLVTVEDCKPDLALCVNRPQENLVHLKEQLTEQLTDPFYDCIRTIMVQIETKIDNYYTQLAVAQARLAVPVQFKPPTEKGSLLYKQWYSAFANKLIVNVEDEALHRDLVCFADYLKVYNDTLLINSDCRSLDALKYLREKVKPLLEPKDNERDTDQWLAGLFNDRVRDLQLFCDDPSNVNTKLIALKENILKKKKEGEPMRCIVFCQTREICSSLVTWANATEGLAELKASFLTGSNAAADKKGLTSNQQNDVIKAFGQGQHQLIFATTVAEEGLDIQACDNVIRYQYVTSMTARIQSRGRARKSEASYTLLASSKEAERDEMNSIREEIQAQAIGIIMGMDAHIYKRKLFEEQRKQQYKRKMGARSKQQELQRERGRLREQGVDYTLVCRKCLSYATPSDDLRVIEGVHHVVISEDFNKNVKIVSNPEKKTYGGWEQTERMYCRKCQEYWGPRCRYLNRMYPVIKIEQFIIVTPQDDHIQIKKWKECPFYIEKYQPEAEEMEDSDEDSDEDD